MLVIKKYYIIPHNNRNNRNIVTDKGENVTQNLLRLGYQENKDLKIVKSQNKTYNQMENNLFSQARSNKDSINSNSIKNWDNLLLYIDQEDIGLKLKQSDILSCLNGFHSAKKQPLYALKAAKHRFWADHWGFFLIYPECGDGHHNKRLIASIKDYFKDFSAKSVSHQSLLSPNKAGGISKTPSNDNRLAGRGFTGNNFFSLANLHSLYVNRDLAGQRVSPHNNSSPVSYNQINILGGLKQWNK